MGRAPIARSKPARAAGAAGTKPAWQVQSVRLAAVRHL
jgi:hypothetical protein